MGDLLTHVASSGLLTQHNWGKSRRILFEESSVLILRRAGTQNEHSLLFCQIIQPLIKRFEAILLQHLHWEDINNSMLSCKTDHLSEYMIIDALIN